MTPLLPPILRRLLAPFFTQRFLKFALVGASGVVVNLGGLAVLKRLGLQANLADAAAIELSIISNFCLNQLWTFRDRAAHDWWGRQLIRFNVVSSIGAGIQWVSFVVLNLCWLLLTRDIATIQGYHAGTSGFFQRWVVHPIQVPPDVGNWIYLSSVIGIGLATGWNFLANFHWTWAHRGAPGTNGGTRVGEETANG